MLFRSREHHIPFHFNLHFRPARSENYLPADEPTLNSRSLLITTSHVASTIDGSYPPDHEEVHAFDTALGRLRLAVFEDGVPPPWRLRVEAGKQPSAGSVSLQTRREDGATEIFVFTARDGYLESVNAVPEPHAFTARLSFSHGETTELHEIAFHEHDHDAVMEILAHGG